MANIKSFNLVGVGSQVQFGKNGLNIAQDAGAFAFRDVSNTTLVPVEVATPTQITHAVTKLYVDNLTLDNLADVVITSAADKQVVQYNLASGKFVNATLAAADVSFDNTTLGLAGSPATMQAALNAVVQNGTAHIRDNNTNPTAQVATDDVAGEVTISASTGTELSKVATFKSGAGAVSSLTIDNSATPTGIAINAYSASVADVNIYLNPQGNGRVFLGNNNSDSQLQADDNQDLVLAGGDSATANGGNLILKAGHTVAGGSYVDGTVKVEDGNGNALLTFGDTTTADSNVQITNGTGKAEIAVVSTETNADLLLAPKGTGAVDISGANLHNVADPVNDTDGANKEYVDTQLNTSIQANKLGSFQNVVGTATTATANLASAIKGEVRNVTIMIQTPYAGGATLQIGTAANPTLISDGSQIDETSAGMYPVTCSALLAVATQLVVTIVGAPTAGAARILIDYVQG